MDNSLCEDALLGGEQVGELLEIFGPKRELRRMCKLESIVSTENTEKQHVARHQRTFEFTVEKMDVMTRRTALFAILLLVRDRYAFKDRINMPRKARTGFSVQKQGGKSTEMLCCIASDMATTLVLALCSATPAVYIAWQTRIQYLCFSTEEKKRKEMLVEQRKKRVRKKRKRGMSVQSYPTPAD
jgi:hypothetical protein